MQFAILESNSFANLVKIIDDFIIYRILITINRLLESLIQWFNLAQRCSFLFFNRFLFRLNFRKVFVLEQGLLFFFYLHNGILFLLDCVRQFVQCCFCLIFRSFRFRNAFISFIILLIWFSNMQQSILDSDRDSLNNSHEFTVYSFRKILIRLLFISNNIEFVIHLIIPLGLRTFEIPHEITTSHIKALVKQTQLSTHTFRSQHVSFKLLKLVLSDNSFMQKSLEFSFFDRLVQNLQFLNLSLYLFNLSDLAPSLSLYGFNKTTTRIEWQNILLYT